MEKSDKKIMIEEAMSILRPIEREVVARRHGLISGEAESFVSIAHHFDRSGEWARNVYTKGIRRMKKRLLNRKGEFEVN